MCHVNEYSPAKTTLSENCSLLRTECREQISKYNIIISAQMHIETIVSLYIIYHQESLVKPAFAFQEFEHHHHQILEEKQGISEVSKDEWPMEKTWL